MADEVIREAPRTDREAPRTDQKAVDVFTHSSTGFPGAWSEDEINLLLEAWKEVVELGRSPSRRFDVAQKVMVRLRKKGFRRVEKDVIKKQMNTLRTEYKTYQGLLKIGIPTVRASCVDQLERILGKDGTSTRKRQDSSDMNHHADAVSEDSDHSHRLSVSYGDDDGPLQNGNTTLPEMTVSNQNKRVRFQRRSFQRSIRAMIGQQQTMLEQVQKAFNHIEESNDKMVSLLTELVAAQKISPVDETSEFLESFKDAEDI